MEREIVFHGKRLDNGEWVEGFYVRCKPRLAHLEVHYKNYPRSYIQTVDEEGFAILLVEVDPSTVGQYTGMKDKHEKRIFEGDIALNVYGKPTRVVWIQDQRHSMATFGLAYGNLKSPFGFGMATAGDCEVVGNIHDNPELLRESQP